MTIKYVSSKLVAELTLASIKGGIIVRHSIFKGSHYEAGYVYGKELSLQRIMLGEMYKRSEDKEGLYLRLNVQLYVRKYTPPY